MESERDMQDIRQELTEGGYLRETGQKKKMKLPASKPMVFRSSDGFEILVGRNNRQNDLLTCKLAQKQDIWRTRRKSSAATCHRLRARNAARPDRHRGDAACRLFLAGARGAERPGRLYARQKRQEARRRKAGMVIYDHYSTAVVTPDAALAEKLREG